MTNTTNTTNSTLTLLVGTHFYTPGKQLLALLPAGCPLVLVPEPENPWDEDAIKVLLIPSTVEIRHEELQAALLGTGWEPEDFWRTDSIQLGHVAKTGGKPLQRSGLTEGNKEILAALAASASAASASASASATLGFSGAGLPLILVQYNN